MAITQKDSEKELNHGYGFMKRHPEFFSSSHRNKTDSESKRGKEKR